MLIHCACTFFPQRKKRWVSWVHATTPRWPSKIYIHYCLCHPFFAYINTPSLIMGTSVVCVNWSKCGHILYFSHFQN